MAPPLIGKTIPDAVLRLDTTRQEQEQEQEQEQVLTSPPTADTCEMVEACLTTFEAGSKRWPVVTIRCSNRW